MVMGIIDSMITRICVSLPSACVSVDEEAAEHLLELFRKMTEAVNLLQDASLTDQWQKTLQVIARSSSTSPVISGYATRLLSDFKQLQPDELLKDFISRCQLPCLLPLLRPGWKVFLKGSGTVLLLDDGLWTVSEQLAGTIT